MLRHSIDLYNDNQVEKFIRKIAKRLEIGTSIARKILQELTKELENHRFILVENQQQAAVPYFKDLAATELRAAEAF